MTQMFGSKAPSRYALDAIRAARTDRPVFATTQKPTTKSRSMAPSAIRLDAQYADQWPARDQYGRGTCVAFATLAAVELQLAVRQDLPPERLSEQYLHERMTNNHSVHEVDGVSVPEGGVLLRQAFSALEADGVIESRRAPYKPAAYGSGRGKHKAPTPDVSRTEQADPIVCRAYGTIGVVAGLDPDRVDNIHPGVNTAAKLLGFLRQGLPVAVGVPLFQHASGLNNWILPSTIRSGIVLCPEDKNAPPLDGPLEGGHVVCLIGYIPDQSEPLGGWFVFRNSWGLGFASHPPNMGFGPTAGVRGHGVISATHLNSYCWEYLVPVDA